MLGLARDAQPFLGDVLVCAVVLRDVEPVSDLWLTGHLTSGGAPSK
jgi:hypothetical protein